MSYTVSLESTTISITLSNWCYIEQRCDLVSTLPLQQVQLILSCLSSSVEQHESMPHLWLASR